MVRLPSARRSSVEALTGAMIVRDCGRNGEQSSPASARAAPLIPCVDCHTGPDGKPLDERMLRHTAASQIRPIMRRAIASQRLSETGRAGLDAPLFVPTCERQAHMRFRRYVDAGD